MLNADICEIQARFIKWATHDPVMYKTLDEKNCYKHVEYNMIDLNSSKPRQDVTLLLSGYSSSNKKLGYDCDTHAVEVKPKLYTGEHKLDGSANYSDLNQKRHNKYIADDVLLLYSGWNESGKLIFIVGFKYTEIATKMQSLIKNNTNGKHVRTASFTLNHWKSNFTLIYKSPLFKKYRYTMAPKLYSLLSNTIVGGNEKIATQTHLYKEFFECA